MEEQIVVFLDLLGFSQCVEDNIQSAKSKMLNYESTIVQMNTDKYCIQKTLDPVTTKYLKQSTAMTFKYFIPASDSIFISSDSNSTISSDNCDINLFVMQLCKFLYNSYKLTSRNYENPINEQEATDGKQVIYNSQTKQADIGITTYSPCLFRGGISIGECEPLIQNRIINNQLTQDCCNLVGKAVAEAVHIEGIVAGPRVVIRERYYERFDLYVRSHYFRKVMKSELKDNFQKNEETFYELLWPAIVFIRGNGIHSDLNKLDETLKGAYNLWKSKSNAGAKKHYEAFIEMVYNSILTFWENDDKAKAHVDNLKRKYVI